MTRLLLLVGVMFIPPPTTADSLSIETGVFTKHIDHQHWMNEDNEIVTIEYKFNRHGINYSKFTNTYGNGSVSIGGSYTIYGGEYADIDILYGTIKGYTEEEIGTFCKSGWCVYVAPRISTEFEMYEYICPKVSIQIFGTAIVGTAGISYKF